MAKTKQLPGGRLWTEKTEGVPGWSSEDGDFDILLGKGIAVLVAFEHDPVPGSGQDFWAKRFATVEEAMRQAEMM